MNKQFRTQWVAAGYRSDMGSAEVVPPPSPEWIRAYHLTSAEFAISDIAFGRMKVARFSDLNDPFELLALNLRERRVRKVVRDFKDALDSDTGLLCFSADWTSPVLWSHYGAKHRGICLGFDLKRDIAQEVQYQDERILASLGDEGSPLEIGDELQELLLRTKYRHWEYEREIRAIVQVRDAIREGTVHFYPFSQDFELVEVILGPKCTLPIDAVRQLVQARYPRATTFRSRLAFKFFKVVPDKGSVPTYRKV